ncbi:MAG TPA: muconolactone Delta-isomerase family protein [Roseiflexaceae bacterium]|nr:muconolactone Delta-isomerase family protein [Roseiflexaceae bacterium]
MRFLVETTLNQTPTPEIMALIPAEAAYGRTLDMAGIREQLFVAADMSRAWQIYRGETPEAVRAIVATFPLYPFLKVNITPLAEN